MSGNGVIISICNVMNRMLLSLRIKAMCAQCCGYQCLQRGVLVIAVITKYSNTSGMLWLSVLTTWGSGHCCHYKLQQYEWNVMVITDYNVAFWLLLSLQITVTRVECCGYLCLQHGVLVIAVITNYSTWKGIQCHCQLEVRAVVCCRFQQSVGMRFVR